MFCKLLLMHFRRYIKSVIKTSVQHINLISLISSGGGKKFKCLLSYGSWVG